MKRSLCGWVILLGFVIAARCEPLGTTILHDMGDGGRTVGRLASAPFHGSAKDYAVAGGIVAGIAATAFLDRSVRSAADSLDVNWARSVSDIGHVYQMPLVGLSASGALYVGGLVFAEPSLRRTGLEAAEAICIAALGTQALKSALGRHRPESENGPFRFSGFTTEDIHQSFPSGDVTTAFALSSVLAAEAKSPPVTVALYALASTTAIQRLHRDRHWFSDTIGAAACGTAVGIGVVRIHRSLNSERSRMTLRPVKNGLGLAINI